MRKQRGKSCGEEDGAGGQSRRSANEQAEENLKVHFRKAESNKKTTKIRKQI